METKPKIKWIDDDQADAEPDKAHHKNRDQTLDEWTRLGSADKKPHSESESKSPAKKTRKTNTEIHIKIDLHGKTLEEAKDHVTREIKALLPPKPKGSIKIRIITGKGHHNRGSDSILANEIQPYIKRMFSDRIVSIQDSPGDIKALGLPIRGHFDVTLR